MLAYQNRPVVRLAQQLTQPLLTLLLCVGFVFDSSAAADERVTYSYPYSPPVSSRYSTVNSVEYASVGAPCAQCIVGVSAAPAVHQFGVASGGQAATYHSFFRHQPMSYVVVGNEAHQPAVSKVIWNTTPSFVGQTHVTPVIVQPGTVSNVRTVPVEKTPSETPSARVFSATDAASRGAVDGKQKVLPPPVPMPVEPPKDSPKPEVPNTKNQPAGAAVEMTPPGPPQKLGYADQEQLAANRAPVPSEPKILEPTLADPDLDSAEKRSVETAKGAATAVDSSSGSSPEIAPEQLAKEQLAKEKLAKEQLAKEQLAKEQLAKEQLAKEKLAKEKLTKANSEKAEAEKRKRKKKRNTSADDSKKKTESVDLPNPLLAWNLDGFPIGKCDDGRESAEIVSNGSLRIDSNNGLDLKHGWVQFPSSSKTLLEGIRKAKAFSVAVSVTCTNNSQKGPARILSCSKDTDHRNFTLGQDAKRFVIRIRTGDRDKNGTVHEKSFGTVKPGHQQLVVVTYDGRRLYCYVDGDNKGEHKFSADFGSWERFSVVAGNEVTGDRKWSGTIHSMVVLPTADPKKLSRLFSDDSK